MDVVQRTLQLLGRGQNTDVSSDAAVPSDAAEGSNDDVPSDVPERSDVQLFRCDSCDTTYISEEMDTCPECHDAVETTPSERELGLL